MFDYLGGYVPILLSLLLTLAIGAYAWRHRAKPGICSFIYLSIMEVSWMIGYILELASPNIQAKIFWDDFQFIGLMCIPYFLLTFAYDYTGDARSLSTRTRILWISLPVIFLVLLYTNPLHGWVRTPTARIVPGKPFDILLYDFTPIMWVSFVYSYLAYIIAMILLLRNLRRTNRLFQFQSVFVILGFTIPIIGSIPGMAGIILFGQRDITPYTFGISNLIYAWGLFRFGLFNIAPIARAAVFENMSDMVVVLDMDSRVVDINRAALTGLKRSVADVLGKPAVELVSGQPDMVALFDVEGPIRKDVAYIANDQLYILDVSLSPLYNNSSSLIGRLFVARDITLQKQMQEALRKTNENLEEHVRERTLDLERANLELESKNIELERFTYTVSHDLKSPLVTINGYIGYLRQDIESGNVERQKKDLERITSAVDRMHKLLNDLLELSRIGRIGNPPEWIEFETLVHEAVKVLHASLESKKIQVKVQPDLPMVHGDKVRLNEVIQNLVENSAKFMGNQPEPRVEIGMDRSKISTAAFYVRDNGIGIAPEYHNQIFGLFNRLDPAIEGTGVGLTLVKRIVEYHGGEIWVESVPGQGAAFYFTLGNTKPAPTDKNTIQ